MHFLDKYFSREKHLRRLEREANRLSRARLDAPVVPLERAVQRGWVKMFVLADRVDRRPDALIFRLMLAAVNRSVWSHERSFVHHHTGQPIVLRPRVIPFREMERPSWPASHRRLFVLGTWRFDFEQFATGENPDRYSRSRGVRGYKLVEMGWLREDLQPHLITHQPVDLPDVKSRLAEIESYMTHHRGWDRLNRLHGRRCWRNHWRESDKRREFHLADQLASSVGDT